MDVRLLHAEDIHSYLLTGKPGQLPAASENIRRGATGVLLRPRHRTLVLLHSLIPATQERHRGAPVPLVDRAGQAGHRSQIC